MHARDVEDAAPPGAVHVRMPAWLPSTSSGRARPRHPAWPDRTRARRRARRPRHGAAVWPPMWPGHTLPERGCLPAGAWARRQPAAALSVPGCCSHGETAHQDVDEVRHLVLVDLHGAHAHGTAPDREHDDTVLGVPGDPQSASTAASVDDDLAADRQHRRVLHDPMVRLPAAGHQSRCQMRDADAGLRIRPPVGAFGRRPAAEPSPPASGPIPPACRGSRQMSRNVSIVAPRALSRSARSSYPRLMT